MRLQKVVLLWKDEEVVELKCESCFAEVNYGDAGGVKVQFLSNRWCHSYCSSNLKRNMNP